ncbi:MAG: glycosyltransferase [Clostridia bacterium]|nr:glycosyltransferase [Clostridia bacterium]
MKVTFYSNFLTHHQTSFCNEMYKRLGNDFKFVSTVKIFQWRLDLGFEDLDQKYDYVVRSYESEEQYNEAKRLAMESDVVIIGSTTDELIEERLKLDKLTFRYRARVFIFPDGFWKTVLDKDKMQLFWNRHIKYRKNENLYMLCANAYGANDFNKLGLYKGKTYKWGYFLENNIYDIDKLIEQKEKNEKMQLIWVARFISWKHPEIVLKLAKNLKAQGYKFNIQMLGTGKLEEKMRNRVKKEKLEDVIDIVGQVPSDKVKGYMEKANIFIGTSDSYEGWGAVINESMNAGCAIVANEKMGSVPFLIGDSDNGLMYKNYQDLENKVKQLMENKELRTSYSKKAYNYITTEWTGAKAAENIIEMFDSVLNNTELKVKNGPASRT